MENKNSCVHRDQTFLLNGNAMKVLKAQFIRFSIYQACCFFSQKRLRAFVDLFYDPQGILMFECERRKRGACSRTRVLWHNIDELCLLDALRTTVLMAHKDKFCTSPHLHIKVPTVWTTKRMKAGRRIHRKHEMNIIKFEIVYFLYLTCSLRFLSRRKKYGKQEKQKRG